MFEPLIFLFVSFGLVFVIYSVLSIYKALNFLRFPKLLMPIGLGFIGGTLLSVGILFLHLGGVLDKYGWIIFIYPCVVGPLSILAVYSLRRKLHAS